MRTYILIEVLEMKKMWKKYSYAIILVGLSCLSALVLSFTMDSPDENNYIKVTVSQGDSIWKIADQYKEENNMSKDRFVSWVKLHNEVNGDKLIPGQELVIPVKEEILSTGELASAAGE
jgi:cell division protein YceG involved in septum cleavage